MNTPTRFIRASRVGLAALALFSGLALAACGGGSSSKDNASTETTLAPAIQPGQTLPPGTTIVVQNDLSANCAQAIEPLRGLMKSYKNGFELDQAGIDTMNKALGAGASSCSPEEWQRFQSQEFRGWLSPAK